MNMPDGLEYVTADTIAETFPGISSDLYGKLWGFVADAKKPTPLGGDGSDGTVETPDGQLDLDNDDKTPHWWSKLTDEEQKVIVAGHGR